VQQAISRPGLLYHATIQFTARLGQGRNIVTQAGPPLRQWVDARHDVAREEQNGRVTLLTAQRNYHRDETMQAMGASSEQGTRAFLARIPLGRMGEPDDIAKVVLFLVSRTADYMTGSLVVVDGGYLLT
jgi:NAD(P)-dependent dehydrogenase (short-subunit alcohol dehydrogenase family)